MRRFRKVLVANRGEIAVRVMRTLREMNISSVAVHSEADRQALHVRVADEAHEIGPAEPRSSYLDIERVLDACKRSGAEAVHPGYGFLSENAAFAEECERRGITFIGPRADAMAAMGSKLEARRRMQAAGVPVVPGAEVHDVESLKAAVKSIGYPVLLKASAGGGGKGMRHVEHDADLAPAYERARSEARNAFGDDVVYVEKQLVGARHVEVQVLGDTHGGRVHLFERDCSIQRRHQKIVEETPTPARDAFSSVIDELCTMAVRAADAVDYHSAGTVECLLGADGSFYFLEMNTRLQVEHPITEWVTGIDLVREQVRVAQGERLGYTQAQVQRRGHAIECRVYAEDPASGFLPSPGPIRVLRVPGGPFVRDDSSVFAGGEVGSHYDPLVSKLSVWAEDRPRALERMSRALSEYRILGLRSNLTYLREVVRHPAFVSGGYDTRFVDRFHEELIGRPLTDESASRALVAAAVLAYRDGSSRTAMRVQPKSDGIDAWRMVTRSRN